MGKLSNVLCQVGVTTIIAKFLILDIPIDHDAPIVVGRGFLYTMGSILNTPERLFSTFDGYVIKRNTFGASIYGPKPAPYLNCTNLEDRSSAIQTSKNIIKFRLGGRAYSLTLLEFARRLGLYQAVELEEEGFNVYFKRGLRNNDNFNAQDYWLSISREDNLGLSRSYTSTIRNLILRAIHKMITYGLCQRTTRYDKIQKNDLWLLSMFDARHQNGVLTEDVVRSLSAQIYCRDLDTITFRYLIDSKGKLIPDDPQLGVPRVGIPRPPRASMQDLYDRMGRMEIHQDAIERMEYRQSYH
ncbi:hypothetical protein Tco_1531541 [Tanacetum coccineum]